MHSLWFCRISSFRCVVVTSLMTASSFLSAYASHTNRDHCPRCGMASCRTSRRCMDRTAGKIFLILLDDLGRTALVGTFRPGIPQLTFFYNKFLTMSISKFCLACSLLRRASAAQRIGEYTLLGIYIFHHQCYYFNCVYCSHLFAH